MLFVWTKGTSQPTAFKCHVMPSNGHGKAVSYIAKHVLKPEEESLPIRELALLYPAPEYTDQ
jgi:hypothetical protein